jgi:hypothetical protein
VQILALPVVVPYVPAAQGLHALPAVDVVPNAHAEHVEAPDADVCPAKHWVQLVVPVRLPVEYVFAAHVLQEVERVLLENEPAAHGIHCVLPALE